MAKFIGSGRQKGILESMQFQIGNKNKNLNERRFTTSMIKPIENIVNTEILDYFDDSIIESNRLTEDQEKFENNKFWMNIIKPKKTEYLSTIEIYKYKQKIYETANGILSLLALIISEFEYELSYYPTFIKNDNQNFVNEPYSGDSSRVIVTLICGVMCIVSFFSCTNEYRIKREQKKIVNVGFISSYYFIRLLIELVINLTHPFPFYDFYFSIDLLGLRIKYFFQTFLYAFMYLKLVHIVRVITLYTKFKTVQSEKYCDHYGGEADTIFALKSLQKENPFLILSISFMLNSFFVGLLLRMFEILNLQTNGNIDYYFYTNGMWNICIAMTTVGYGEFFPKTHIGRFLTVYGIFSGIFIASFLTVALNNACSFDINGLKSYMILKRSYHKKELYENSVIIIQNLFRQFLLRKTYSKKILKNVKTKQFKQIAISKIQKKSKKFHDNNVNLIKLKRNLQYILLNRRTAKNLIDQESYISTDYKFVDLTDRIYDNLNSIKKEFYKLEEFKSIIRQNITQSEKILEFLENSIKITKLNVKRKFLNLILKNDKGIHDYLQINPKSNESNVSLDSIKFKQINFDEFFPFKKPIYFNDKYLIDKMLSEKVDESYLKIKNLDISRHKSYDENNEAYNDSQSKSFLPQDETLNNIVLREDFHYMDKITRVVLKSKSRKTYDLLTDLKKMRLKLSNEKANKAIWDEENPSVQNIENKSVRNNTENNIVQMDKVEINEQVSPFEVENKIIDNNIENFENISPKSKAEEKIETKKPLLYKLESRNKEQKESPMEQGPKEELTNRKVKENVPSGEENIQFKEIFEENDLSRKPDNGGGDTENIKFQINNKINNINKLLVGVINNNKKEKSNNLFTDESKIDIYLRQSKIKGN